MYMSCFLMLISIYNVALSAQSIPISFKDTYFCVHTRHTPCEPAQLTGIKSDIGRESPHTSGRSQQSRHTVSLWVLPLAALGVWSHSEGSRSLISGIPNLAPRNRPRRDRYEGHTESDVVYTRVYNSVHTCTQWYTRVYTSPS